MALLTFGGLIYIDRRVDADLRREEELFLAMGVDVREVGPGDDAAPEYEAVARQLGRSDSISETLLRRLEKAAEKPVAFSEDSVAFVTNMQFSSTEGLAAIYHRILTAALTASEKHDWSTLDRLYKLHERIQQQCAAGHSNTLAGAFFITSLPLMDLKNADAQTRVWLRKRWEKIDLRQMHAAHLAGIARLISRGGMKGPSSTLPADPWWKKLVEKQTLFRKSARLALLRQWRPIVEQRQKRPSNMSHLNRSVGELRTGLVGLKKWPSDWAATPLGFVGPMFSLSVPVSMALIQIDLRDQREQGKPIVPTWSKRYCVDPDSGDPIGVRVTAKGIDFLFKGGLPTPWNSHVRW